MTGRWLTPVRRAAYYDALAANAELAKSRRFRAEMDRHAARLIREAARLGGWDAEAAERLAASTHLVWRGRGSERSAGGARIRRPAYGGRPHVTPCLSLGMVRATFAGPVIEYGHIERDPVIGAVEYAGAVEHLAIVVAHEVAHVAQWTKWAHAPVVPRPRAHGREWIALYRQIRPGTRALGVAIDAERAALALRAREELAASIGAVRATPPPDMRLFGLPLFTTS